MTLFNAPVGVKPEIHIAKFGFKKLEISFYGTVQSRGPVFKKS